MMIPIENLTLRVEYVTVTLINGDDSYRKFDIKRRIQQRRQTVNYMNLSHL